MKKAAAFLLAVIVFAVSSLFGVEASAVGATTGQVDVVFLVDSSRSMLKSDPDYIRLEAIKLFSDLCSLGNTKIGFVLFGNEIIYSQEPVPIDTLDDRANIKNKVDELRQMKGSTDIGRAVLYAAEMLASDDYNRSGKFIIFLSDGKTVIPERNAEGRTLEDSQSDLSDGLVTARNAGIPIYTIGLNADGEVDEAELSNISKSTYAEDTYMTESAETLSQILSDIYVHHTGAETGKLAEYTSDGEYREVSVDVADSAVVEANVVLMHSALPDDVKIYDPSGAEITPGEAGTEISRNDGYSLVKLGSPAKGKWKISAKFPKESSVFINYIITRDYRIDFSLLTDKPAGEGAKLKFSAVMTDPSLAPVTDEDVLSSFSAKAIVKNSVSGVTREAELTRDSKNVFRGEFVLTERGEHTVQISLTRPGTDIRSDIITLVQGEASFLEPEGPLKLILLISAFVVMIGVLVFFIIKYLKDNMPIRAGSVVLTAVEGDTETEPEIYDFSKYANGRRKLLLSDILRTVYSDQDLVQIIPKKLASSIALSMNDVGDLCIAKIRGVDYTGGITVGRHTVLTNARKLTLTYKGRSGEDTNKLIIQYEKDIMSTAEGESGL